MHGARSPSTRSRNHSQYGGPGSGQSACSHSSIGGSSSFGLGSRAYSIRLGFTQERVADWCSSGMAHPAMRNRSARWAAAPTWHAAGARLGSLRRAGPLCRGAAPGGAPSPWGLRGGVTSAPVQIATHLRAIHSAPWQAAICIGQHEAVLVHLQSLLALTHAHSAG